MMQQAFSDMCMKMKRVFWMALKNIWQDMPSYHPKFFRVTEPKDPRFPSEDLYRLIPFNQKDV